eukprot:4351561-Pyramimonas_sp.AAC.1
MFAGCRSGARKWRATQENVALSRSHLSRPTDWPEERSGSHHGPKKPLAFASTEPKKRMVIEIT